MYELLLFISICILLNISPGPNIIYLINVSIFNTKKASFIVNLGISLGLIIHTSLLAFGISTIIKNSPLTFNILKILGIFYLFYLGYIKIKNRYETINLEKIKQKVYIKLFTKAFLINILNPKVLIFFLAFLPQFVKDEKNMTYELLKLGLIFTLVSFSSFSFIGITANILGKKILKKVNPIYINLSTALILFAFCITLIFTNV